MHTPTEHHASTGTSHQQLFQLIFGTYITNSLAVAARLNIADLLREGPRTIEQLADASASHAPTLLRLLRALASVGVFAQDADGRFMLTPMAALLQANTPNSLRDYAILNGSEMYARALVNLQQSVHTGQPAFELTYGMNLFEHLQQQPADAAMFNAAMTSISQQEAVAVRDAYDFAGCRVVADIGAGHGILLATILQGNPSLEGILFDRPAVVQGARPLLERMGVAERVRVVSGDFFAEVPQGADAYLLKYIIHDWDDERSRQILSRCREALSPHGKVLVVDAVLPSGNEPYLGKLKDIIMLTVAAGGMERTAEEFEALFASADLRLTRIIPTQSLVSIVEGVPQ